MSYNRLSQSLSSSWLSDSYLLSSFHPSDTDSSQWLKHWESVLAKDLIDSRIVPVDEETSVEEACDILLKEDIPCLAVKATCSTSTKPFIGLFDFSDVNAFLTLAATRHTLLPEYLRENTRINQIVSAAIAGRVPVQLVSNLSEKNPLEILPEDASILDLLKVFSLGTHRVLVRSCTNEQEYLGMVSDGRLLSWFASYAKETPAFKKYSSNTLNSLYLPSLNLNSAVVSSTSNETVLDAMKLMSEEGVSSIAILDEETGNLLSAVSVTDIGRVVVPYQSNHILSAPLHKFVSLIKVNDDPDPDGSMDGIDKYPVYSVYPYSTLSYTIEKLLATNAHRVFVTQDSVSVVAPLVNPAPLGKICGIVSIVDILSLFARLAKIPNIDPTMMQRHRRASSASSSSRSERDLFRSRSNSRTAIRGSPILVAASPPVMIGSPDSGISNMDLHMRERLQRRDISS
ncbi:hypothetical protein AMATHDRAFT_5574 [Amanita thiersii Skay4041]|uniref:CBS domain-containing protein n=1 Tax=Amanita thiersii Skay4041 TaxID=703135 RepID=A0A2A9NLT7_9AGAR|nr:hypothetical protein AMATHDRAFT_5574 [Amanita thiersii Skay4041]